MSQASASSQKAPVAKETAASKKGSKRLRRNCEFEEEEKKGVAAASMDVDDGNETVKQAAASDACASNSTAAAKKIKMPSSPQKKANPVKPVASKKSKALAKTPVAVSTEAYRSAKDIKSL